MLLSSGNLPMAKTFRTKFCDYIDIAEYHRICVRYLKGSTIYLYLLWGMFLHKNWYFFKF